MSTTHLLTYDPTYPKLKKPRKTKWELNQILQDIWATKWSWGEVVMGPTSNMFLARCKVCTFVKKKKSCLSPNLMAYKRMLGGTRALLQG